MSAKDKVATCLAIRDWSARKVAIKAGVAETSFHAWLNNQNRDISFETIGAVARTLGVSLDWLANDSLPDDAVPSTAWIGIIPGGAPLEPGLYVFPHSDGRFQDLPPADVTAQVAREGRGDLKPTASRPKRDRKSPGSSKDGRRKP